MKSLHSDVTVRDLDSGDPGFLADLGAPPPRTLDQREGELARVDVTVGRQKGGAQHPIR